MSDESVAVEAVDQPEVEKHAGGRPRKYATPEELEAVIDAWAAKCEAGDDVYTISGLTLALGFGNHSSVYDYGKYPGFELLIARARLLIENSYEKRLYLPNATGSIFALKQFGWSDKQEIEHSGGIDIDIHAVRERVENRVAGIADRLLASGNGSHE